MFTEKVQNKFPEKPKLSHVFRQITVFFSFKLQKPWAENLKISFSHCSLYCGNCCPKITIRWIIQKLRFSLTRERSCFYHARIFNINSLSQKVWYRTKFPLRKNYYRYYSTNKVLFFMAHLKPLTFNELFGARLNF